MGRSGSAILTHAKRHCAMDPGTFTPSFMNTDGDLNQDARNALRAQVGMPPLGDKVPHEKRLKEEILLLRALATIVSEHKAHLVCEGPFGRAVADQKEATLFDLVTKKPLRWEPFKSHLYAAHRALCWSVLGVFENRFGELR